MSLLVSVFRKIIHQGHLTLIDAAGRVHEIGVAEQPGITVRLHDKATERAILLNPQLALGEAYMDGRLTVETGGIAGLLDLLMKNLGMTFGGGHWEWLATLRRWTKRVRQRNNPRSAKHNVAHHYDLSAGLYDLFLDSDKQYSCAFFETPDDSLETAQQNKCRRIAAKLDLKPGQRVLDIGSGWGGLGLHLAETADVDVTGITLSEDQLKIAQDRAARQGLSDRVRFRRGGGRGAGGGGGRGGAGGGGGRGAGT